MGSYAALKIGRHRFGDWKSHIPLEPLLAFVQEDLELKTRKHDGELFYSVCRFRTTVGQARHRLDQRGVTMAFCRKLFEEFRSTLLWNFNPATGEDLYEPNDLDFETYCMGVKKLLSIPLEQRLRFEHGNEPSDPVLAAISHEDFFTSEFWRYFADGASCLSLRVMLEVAKPTATVTFDIQELVNGGYVDAELVPRLYQHFLDLMLRRIGLDYQIYGFATFEDPNLVERLRARITGLSEDQLINRVLLPLLSRMKFERLRRVTFHGPGEFGSDVLPFRARTPLGTLEYYALQAKAVPIHGTASKSGNAPELVSQAAQAFAVTFVDDLDNERKHLDKFIIVTNKAITGSARQYIESAIEGRRKLIFLDGDALVQLIRDHGLVQYVLFTDFNIQPSPAELKSGKTAQ